MFRLSWPRWVTLRDWVTFGSTLLCFCWLLFVGIIAQSDNDKAPTPSIVSAIKQSKGQTIWISQSSNAEDFANELSNLFVTLYNTGRLSVVTDLHSDASTLEGVARQQHLLIGPIFPIGLESLICDLNASVCVRDRTDRRANGGDPLSSTIQGAVISRALLWNATPDTSLTLPDIKLERISKWTRLHKDLGDEIEHLVVKKYGGCESFDEMCKANILAYNRNLDATAFMPDWAGDISLPVVAARAQINVAGITVSEPSDNKSSSIGSLLDGGLAFFRQWDPHNFLLHGRVYKVDPTWAADSSFGKVINNVLLNQKAVIDNIGENIGSILLPKLFSTEAVSEQHQLIDKEFIEDRNRIRLQTAFPYDGLNKYPATIRGGNIAVFDGWVDKAHCALAAGRVNLEVSNLSSQAAKDEDAKCNMEEKPKENVDHGTHVVGIIASRGPDDVEYGMNPYAHVFAREVDFTDLGSTDLVTAQSASSDLAQQIANVRLTHNVDVVNLSWGYRKVTAGADPVESAIAENWSVLFVAAAGNDGDDKTNNCEIRPACLELPNVIAVAALGKHTEKPELLKKRDRLGTNFGRNVHIAAPGDDVLSTIAFGRYGRMSGTSQATPIVTAVASLLLVENPKLSPIEVKNRLIYCSDKSPELSGKLFGGVLNAECTLDGSDGRLSLVNEGDSPVRHGKFQLGQSVQAQNTVNGKKLTISISAIRGIQADDATGTATIFYNDDPERLDSPLLKEEHVKFIPDEAELSFVQKSGAIGQLTRVKLNQIAKYTSALR
jgi:subtilisin family serine protease